MNKNLILIVLFFLFKNIYCHSCPKDVCGKYNKYSQCWYTRMYNFDYCITYINRGNPLVRNCIGKTVSTINPVITTSSEYKNMPEMFFGCNNTRYNMEENLYIQYLNLGKCFYRIKNKIKNIGNDTNNIEINCFNLPKNK